MIRTFQADLQVDSSRGIIYVDSIHGGSMIRICRLPPEMLEKFTGEYGQLLDITHMFGVSLTGSGISESE